MATFDAHPLLAGTNGAVPHAPGPVGELIESTTTDFIAQACQLDAAPPFGAFVQVAGDDGSTVYGVVAHVQTTGIDPGSRPIMRGYEDIRDDLIYAENPDLQHVLRTTFRSLVVGFRDGGAYRQVLPARPPRLHYSVSMARPAEVRAFTGVGLDYLATLLACADVAADELIAANVRLTAAERPEGALFVRQAGRELAQLLHADYARLAAIVRRIVAGT